MFHPKSAYWRKHGFGKHSNTLPDHTHTITPNPSSSSSQNLKEITLSIGDD